MSWFIWFPYFALLCYNTISSNERMWAGLDVRNNWLGWTLGALQAPHYLTSTVTQSWWWSTFLKSYSGSICPCSIRFCPSMHCPHTLHTSRVLVFKKDVLKSFNISQSSPDRASVDSKRSLTYQDWDRRASQSVLSLGITAYPSAGSQHGVNNNFM